MSILDWTTAAEITGGVWHGKPAVGLVPEFVHDSRRLEPGQAFVALQAQRDGHEFVAQAASAGAVAALVSRPVQAQLCQLVVPDTLRALSQLARQARYRSDCIVVAVTGSTGKTTVCGMITSILVAAFGPKRVLASRGNFNNHIGLPLSLLRLDSEHRYAVLEAGMSKPGELADLAALAEPDLGVVTNIGSAHLGNFSSRSQIAQAKGELLAGTRKSGACVFGFAEEFTDLLADL
ncbi:MAG: UDP-N-acetylmuramoyl-tripeptide--D-alanyl-D-alanine ligase, partial [Betaproteobacteria bacterium]|nr:UDP-N-acetylmuramoyl-tripeptide--D-alanyl-D-alanine ligase [Betaproteobacteria bacterium]